MSWTTLMLVIAGFGLMASGGALLGYDIYLAGQHRRLVRGEWPRRDVRMKVNQQDFRLGSRDSRNEFRRPINLRVAWYASLDSGDRWVKATGASLPNRRASTAALDRFSRKTAEAFGSPGFPPGQRRVPCHPAGGARA